MTAHLDNELDRLLAAAVAQHQEGRLIAAEASYRAALACAPGHPAVLHNLGVLVAQQGRHAAAIAAFDQAIAHEPNYASAHYNRAAALHVLGRTQEAIAGFRRACVLEPAHYAAHRALGFLWLAQGERGRALDHFGRTYELRRGEDRSRIAERSLTHATRGKLCHDAAQFRYLAARTREPRRFEALARACEEVANALPNDVLVPLSDRQRERLGDDYNTAIHLRATPEIAGGALGAQGDRDALARRFRAQRAVQVDDLLTPEALASLRRHLLESTIWHDFSHIGGFVASYLEDGLACPLILQIVDELRGSWPDLLGDHPLSQAWAFKGLAASSAIDAHADDAAISVNFWATPTRANLDPGRGGLAVCLVPPPPDWEIADYHDDRGRAVAFLEQNATNSLNISYRENRAVIFEARLLHRSDAPRFEPSYENHRINLTLLFGHRR